MNRLQQHVEAYKKAVLPKESINQTGDEVSITSAGNFLIETERGEMQFVPYEAKRIADFIGKYLEEVK